MNVWRIIICDLKRILKDGQAALWLLVLPLVFAFIFGSAFRGGESYTLWIGVVDLDRSELSSLFIDQMQEEGYFIDVKEAKDEPALKDQWPCGVVIPSGFQDRILAGEQVRVTVVEGAGHPERTLEVQSRVVHALVRFNKGLALANVSHRPWNPVQKETLEAALSRPPLLEIERPSHRNLRPPPSGFYLSLPGILVMFVLQMIIAFGGVTLVNDRKQGQFARLLAAPVRGFEVYGGKIAARIALGLAQAVLLLIGGAFLFGMDLGESPEFLGPVILCLALLAGSVSLLCGLLCQTEKQVINVSIFAALILSALGGCWWPIEVVPEAFQTLAMFTPSYWAVHGLQSVLYFNKSYEVLTLECPILLGYTSLVAVAIIPLLRRLEGRLPVTT